MLATSRGPDSPAGACDSTRSETAALLVLVRQERRKELMLLIDQMLRLMPGCRLEEDSEQAER